MKRLLALAVLLCSVPFAFAQSQYVQLIGSNITDAAGNKLQSGTITFTPVSSAGAPVAPHLTLGGRAVPATVTFSVVNGAIQAAYGTTQLADVSQAFPQNFCYADTIHDNGTGDTWSPDTCVQPAFNANWCTVSSGQTTCNFDQFLPMGTPGAMVAAPSLKGGTFSTGAAGSPVSCSVDLAGPAPSYALSCTIPQGIQGIQGIPALLGQGKGAYSSTTTYNAGEVVAYNGQSYASFVSSNLGNQPDISSTKWGLLANLSNLPTAFASQSQANPDKGYFSTVAATTPISNSSGGLGNTTGTAQHSLNLPADFSAQSAANPQAATFTALSTLANSSNPPLIIYDDDLASDPDTWTLNAIHYWIDTNQVQVLAFIADSSNPNTAPLMKVFEQYWHHTGIPIGAYQGNGVPDGSASTWIAGVISTLDPGDTRTNYTDCVTEYRTVLAAAANNSVKIVEAGFPTCLVGLLASGADGISSLTGPQLIQAKVISLDIMGGKYPSSFGSPEWNFAFDPSDNNTLFTTWTMQNGYPPIYLNGYANGLPINTGTPLWFPTANCTPTGIAGGSCHPSAYVAQQTSTYNRPAWDVLSAFHAIFGNSSWSTSVSGTNVINTVTGDNTWSSSPASRQYYITTTQPTSYYESFLDGQNFFGTGANGFYPAAITPNIRSYDGLQCNAYNGCSVPSLGIGGNFQFSPSGGNLFLTTLGSEFNFTNSANNTYFGFGQAATAGNSGYLRFGYVGDGSAYNAIGIGFNAGTDVLTLTPSLATFTASIQATSGSLNPYTLTTTANGTYTEGLLLLAPNLTAGHAVDIDFGVAGSNYNEGSIGLLYNGSGSTSNYIRFSFYGGPDAMRIMGTGQVVIPGIHSTTGSRYVCIGTSGELVSSVSACSGT
jgi:hypothetical protein